MKRLVLLSVLLSILVVFFVSCSNITYLPDNRYGWYKYKADEYIYYFGRYPERMGNETEEYIYLYDQPNFEDSFEYSKVKEDLQYIEEQYWGIPKWARENNQWW